MATAQSQPLLAFPDFTTHPISSIDEYLRERLMPAESTMPHIPGIEMFGNSIPAGTDGEVHPSGHFRFVNFGHPSPLMFSAEYSRLMKVKQCPMARFFPLGLQVPAHHPDRMKYYSLGLRQDDFYSSDPMKAAMMNPGNILVLYTDGVYDGSDEQGLEQLESVLRDHRRQPAKHICNALLDYAMGQDDQRRQVGDNELIDDKTVFIVKRT